MCSVWELEVPVTDPSGEAPNTVACLRVQNSAGRTWAGDIIGDPEYVVKAFNSQVDVISSHEQSEHLP